MNDLLPPCYPPGRVEIFDFWGFRCSSDFNALAQKLRFRHVSGLVCHVGWPRHGLLARRLPCSGVLSCVHLGGLGADVVHRVDVEDTCPRSVALWVRRSPVDH